MNPAKNSTNHLFPKGLALGKAFINRTAEREELIRRVLTGEHSWIAAPRRYGKTSLAEQLCLDLEKSKKAKKVHTCIIDLMLVKDIYHLQEMLFIAASELLRKIEPTHKKLLSLAREYFEKYAIDVSFGGKNLAVRFAFEKPSSGTINETLLQLEQIATDHHIKYLLVIDEFQKVAQLKDSEVIEGSIRNAVQKAKNVTYLFSGSHRSMLAQMFSMKSRPLYRLCTQLELDRIDAKEYQKYITRIGKFIWKQEMTESAFTALYEVTKRHPYYVNAICRKIVRRDRPPAEGEVKDLWDKVVAEETHWLEVEFNHLSNSQAALLHTLAIHPTDKPTSKAFTQQCGLAASSVKSALDVLLRDDMVYLVKRSDGVMEYRVLDPGMETILTNTL